MADHRYWRLEIFNWGSQDYVLLQEVEFRESISGSDVTGSGTATSNTEYPGGAHGPEKAFDDNSSTTWASDLNSVEPEWLAYDFGSGNAYDIEEVTITTRSSIYYDVESPVNMALAYSDDGTNWTTKYLWRHITGWTSGGTLTFNINSGSYIAKYNGAAKRYWLVEFHASGGTYGCISESEFRESSGGSDATGSGTAAAHYEYDIYTADLIFDDDLDWNWTSWNNPNNIHGYRWYSYDFGSGVTKNICEITITADDWGDNDICAPWAIIVLCSSDGSTWEWAWTDLNTDGWTSWSNEEQRTFTSPFLGWSGVVVLRRRIEGN